MSRTGERGGVLIVAMVALIALLGLGGLTVLSVRGAGRAASHERFQSVALYAAESGVWAGIEHLRGLGTWDGEVEANNDPTLVSPNPAIPGNTAPPGDPQNLFSPDLLAWYEVEIWNNPGDPGFSAGIDGDDYVILRAVGHGPGGARVVLEVDVYPAAGLPGPLEVDGWRQVY